MAADKWLRVLSAVGGVAAVSERLLARRPAPAADGDPGLPGAAGLGQLEARLASIVVAALKEAFDRDRQRMDLERTHLDAERERAEQALRLELARQSADQALWQIRLAGIMSLAIWVTSAILLAVLPGLGAPLPKALLFAGWAGLVATLAMAAVAQARVVGWLSEVRATVASTTDGPDGFAQRALPWLLVGGLALTGVSLIAAL